MKINEPPLILYGYGFIIPFDNHGIVQVIKVYDPDHIILNTGKKAKFYSKYHLNEGVCFLVKYDNLTQESLWDTYNRCSMDVSVLRRKGGDSL